METLLRIALLALLAQAAPSQPASFPSVEGRVVRAGTTEPLSQVTVDLAAVEGETQILGARPTASRFTATTGDDGRFVIQNALPGEYRLYGTHGNGYVPAEYGQRSPTGLGTPFTLAAGQRMTGVTLNMTPTASISGRVTDGNGDPAVFTSILAFRIVYTQGTRTLEIVQSVLTDDRGDYRIFWLAPGKYYLSAMPIETRQYGLPLSFASRFGGAVYLATPMLAYQASETGEIYEQTWAPIYYPGTTEIRSAKPIVLAAGEHTNANINVAASPTRTLQTRGVVLDATGRPLPNARVTLAPRKPEGHSVVLPAATTNAAGEFNIHGVTPGSYFLFVTGNQPSPVSAASSVPPNTQASALSFVNVREASQGQSLSAAFPVDVGNSDMDNIRIQTQLPVRIPWHVVYETPQGRGGGLPDLNVSLLRDPDLAGAPGTNGRRLPASLESVGAGDYRVWIRQLPQDSYVKSIRMGAVDVLKDGLHVTATAPEELEIVVSAAAGTLDGLVFDNNRDDNRRPFSNATVALVPLLPDHRQNRLDLFKTTASASDGKFHIDRIAPGEYKLFAWEDVRTGDWYDPDFIKDHEFRGVSVKIDEGSVKTLEMPVIPAERSSR